VPANEYWAGNRQAVLTRNQIDAAWGAPGVEHSGGSIGCANRAFEIYFRAHQQISQCQDADHTRVMMDSLHSAGREGWGIHWPGSDHPDDLEEAFQHIANNNGRWRCNNTSIYMGGPNKAYQRNLIRAPTSTVSFLRAVDRNMATLRSVLSSYGSQVQTLNQARQRNQWQAVGSALTNIKNGAQRAKPFLWMAPAAERVAGRTVTFARVLSNLHAGLTTYGQASGSGLDTSTSAALGAMQTAVRFVPVLGSFYGHAIAMIPGLHRWFQQLVQDHVREIDRAANAR